MERPEDTCLASASLIDCLIAFMLVCLRPHYDTENAPGLIIKAAELILVLLSSVGTFPARFQVNVLQLELGSIPIPELVSPVILEVFFACIKPLNEGLLQITFA